MKFCIIFFVFIYATVPVLLCSWMYNPFSFQLTIKMQLIIIRIRIYFICPPRQLIVRLKIELSQLWQCLYVDMLATLTVGFYHIFSSYFVFLSSVILRNTEKVHLHQNMCNLFVSPFRKRSLQLLYGIYKLLGILNDLKINCILEDIYRLCLPSSWLGIWTSLYFVIFGFLEPLCIDTQFAFILRSAHFKRCLACL